MADPAGAPCGFTASKDRVAVYRVLCLPLCAVVFALFVYSPGINGYYRAMFPDMVAGTAYKPFVFRTLLPSAVRGLCAALPDSMRAWIMDTLGNRPSIQNLLNILNWEQESLPEYIVACVLMFACLCGFAGAVRYLFDGLFEAKATTREKVTLVTIGVLPEFFRHSSHIYDFPTLLLFTLGLGLMLRRRWRTFLVVFFLSCLNKETTILLTLVFAIHFRKHSGLSASACRSLLAIQVFLFLAVKTTLAALYRNNPGELAELHLFDDNLDLIRKYPLSTVFAWGGFILLVFYRWPDKPAFLRHSLWVLPPLLVLGMIFGLADELRIYYEACPVVALILYHSIARALHWPLTVRRT